MFHRRGSLRERLEFLRTVPILEGLSDDFLTRLDEHLDDLDVPAGRRLATEGTKAYEAFIIVDGTAQIRVEGEVVGEASSGELIGEVALLEGRTRTATMSAVTPMRLLALDSGALGLLLAEQATSGKVRETLSRHESGPQSSR